MFDSREQWFLRPPGEEEDDEDAELIYETSPTLFTLKIHYKGTFHLTPLREYKEGKLRIIDMVDMDYFNLVDMDVIALGAGYEWKKLCLYLWRLPGKELDNGLRPLQSDEDVAEFLTFAARWRFMEVYLDSNPMRNICMLTTIVPTTVKLKEVTGDEDMQFLFKDSEASSEDVQPSSSSSVESEEEEDSVDEMDVHDSDFEDLMDEWDEALNNLDDNNEAENFDAPGTPQLDETGPRESRETSDKGVKESANKWRSE